jgi:hypothetical protein
MIVTHPPSGGQERKEVQQNLSIHTDVTACIFLQHFCPSEFENNHALSA